VSFNVDLYEIHTAMARAFIIDRDEAKRKQT